MNQVRVVTDSTADLPADLRAKLGIALVPLKVNFGTESYRDGIDMNPDEFYAKLASSAELPKTSQPSPTEFQEVYERLAEQGEGPIISIHLGSNFSGTYQSAVLAKSMVEDKADVTVVDSLTASFGIGAMAIAAAEASMQGKSKDEILGLIAEVRQAMRIYFLVDTLEYLQKGGRIGRAAALVGSLLNIKPILSISDDGYVASVDKVRGQKKAMNRILELLQQEFAGKPIHLALAYSTDKTTAQELEALIAGHFEIRSVQYTHLGPVIGTHVGPGTVAAFASPA
ncbi:DegV family protein [Paenibacillus filicis]|uniref:DegV family protein n=1 Tax=Paenibacillus gyeongsangnamensis TaxID=3388067 RepID=A0ABT4Q3H8_9BACL|nr:DegV family protein [Paenibacillus filicis]MCZ8511437.1 DegV family protein [Paenibacillus filicis]